MSTKITTRAPTPEELRVTYANDVRRGLALLDEHLPEGWDRRIHLERLNMASLSLCVAAQAFGHQDWPYAAVQLGLELTTAENYFDLRQRDHILERLRTLGLTWRNPDHRSVVLTQVWRAALGARRLNEALGD